MLWAPHLAALHTGPDWGALGAMFVGVLTLCGVIYTATRARTSSKEANAVNWNKTLLERIEKLEQKDEEKDGKITELSSVMSVSLTYIERLISWGRGGGRPPEPTAPAQLQDRLAHLINDGKET